MKAKLREDPSSRVVGLESNEGVGRFSETRSPRLTEDAIVRRGRPAEMTGMLSGGMRADAGVFTKMASVLVNIESRGAYVSTEDQAQRLDEKAAQIRR